MAKYKLAGKRKASDGGPKKPEKFRVLNAVGLGLVVLVIGAILYGVLFRGVRQPQRGPSRPAQTASSCPTRPGTAWEYDEPSNCHFDPGHNHWHPGRPPAGSAPAPAGTTPAPAPAPAAPASTPPEDE